MTGVLFALLRGFLVGFAAGIPIGPVNAAVIDAAMRHCVRTAFAIGLGGALVDFVYSQLAVIGLGTVFAAYPLLKHASLAVGGVGLVVYGARTARPRELPPEGTSVPPGQSLGAAFATGVLLTLLNPAALVFWLLVAGATLTDLTRLEALVAGLGIFIGCSAWFLGVAWLAHRGKRLLGERALWIPRTIGAALVVYGCYLVASTGVIAFRALQQ